MVTGMRGDHARSALAGTRFGHLRWVAETGSTNRDLLDLAAAAAPDGTVLVADHQTSGRGRLDRSWHAPPGGSLLVSVLFRLGLPVADSHLLTTAVGLHLPPKLLNVDQEQMLASVRKLVALEPAVVGFGHGPVLRDATAELKAFAAALA